MAKTVIVGGPKVGKTTLAREISANRMHTDDHIGMGWDKAIDHVAKQLSKPDGPEVIEGVGAIRGLRKWLEDNPTGKPCDEVIHIQQPKIPRTKGQETMAKGCETVLKQIVPELERRGVKVTRRR